MVDFALAEDEQNAAGADGHVAPPLGEGFS
jgi:hypothetical protein